MSGKHARPYDREKNVDRILERGTTAHGRHRKAEQPCCTWFGICVPKLGNREEDSRG